jgi:hypothetical protein
MKINIKLKDFLDKAGLQKNLDTRLKKPVQALAKQPGTTLPFCYEAEYFEDGSGFMSIGVSKELHAHFKKQRVKGQGKDEQGKAVKVDKKKVAYGEVSLNEEGKYEFLVQDGKMRKPQLKATIKSIAFLKKNIGDNFVILTKAVEKETEEPTEDGTEETPTDTTSTEETSNTQGDTSTDNGETTEGETQEQDAPSEEATPNEDKGARIKKAMREKKRKKIKEEMPKIQNALGVASADKVKAAIEKYQTVLATVKEEANADGEVDDAEQTEIDQLESTLADLQAHLERIGDKKIKMTPKNRKVVNKKLEEAKAYLAKVKLGLSEA